MSALIVCLRVATTQPVLDAARAAIGSGERRYRRSSPLGHPALLVVARFRGGFRERSVGRLVVND
jgi:hypothetical protein